MGNEYVFEVGGVTASLGVEVCAAVAESAVAYNLHHGLGKLEVVDGELVGVPAVLIVAAVGVDAAEHAVVNSHGELVLECVACEGGVVYLDVYLKVVFKTVGFEEADDGFCVYVVLVLGGFHRLRLDKECAGEAL